MCDFTRGNKANNERKNMYAKRKKKLKSDPFKVNRRFQFVHFMHKKRKTHTKNTENKCSCNQLL